ncbi:MFS transporter [Nakamurella sp. YIM 132087]|uniref:MFS transporter n=1 Tax=Nakamurella alba TaxID=2665158 RepID=A0A7K1FP15_9ACTN|nr:MFS transporter [Nakamurella alba]
MLGLGFGAQAVCGLVVNGAPFLIPTLQQRWGLDLAGAGLLVALPTFGVMATLILWGALADAIGERVVLGVGVLGAAGAVVWAATADDEWWFGAAMLVAGMFAASANAASGRVVVGWFPPERRGLVMGIRQGAQPFGVAVAALTLPIIGEKHGAPAALTVSAIIAGVIGLACALLVRDPPRPPRKDAEPHLTANPYRGSSMLWRIHGVSVLLVMPQFVAWSFALVWLTTERGWSTAAAGVLVTVTQVLGAIGRLVVGAWSDRVRSRMRPLRWVALGVSASMLLLAVTDVIGTPVAVVVLVIASVVSAAPNGLAFTSVAEIGGPFWAGRALGVQNTAQFLAGAAIVPVAGALITGIGYPWTFAIVGLAALLAAPLVPRRDTP